MSAHTEKLIYVDASDAQVSWGSNDDPRGILEPGKAYKVASVDVRSSHTKVELVAFPGKRFNSVCFKQEHATVSEIDSLRAVNADLIAALTEVFSIGDRLVSDVYGGEFVHSARAAIARATAQADSALLENKS